MGAAMAETSNGVRPSTVSPPAQIEIRIGKKVQRVAYAQAFMLACSLLDDGQVEDAIRLFERLAEFTDHGPRALIMLAFCHAAALHFEQCSRPLAELFNGDKKHVAADLHNAFVSYHVGIRQDALNIMVELVNKHPDLPTLCLLLGNMFAAAGESGMAKKCWSLAVHRDRNDGAVAAVATKHLKRLLY
jgi:Flp pilus assembly protein TadD